MKISKNFSEKVWRFEKKMYFCTPKRKEGATGTAGRPGRGEAEAGARALRDRDGREAGTGRGGSRGASPEADAERRVH